ncbi:conserved exported hypothetical protein [Flavobacterium sp. 9AF]|uniref:hypothetical protein n=1 Tax=Flavobacterium sp. 9AF TaxID=2653142 RepID=UPI0012F17F56|nr:hypothetical protein [Flavobacterium sp. 9AF]VXB34129.1 conserved exported hypothetical protein [Flavobacterium sp. 9AF]
MKKTLLIAIIGLCGLFANAQLVQGEMLLGEQSKMEIKLKNNKVVNLYAAFREGNYPLHFIFTTDAIPLNEDKKEVVQFVFTTTVKKEGKIIGSSKRNPIPFFPGDMFMPVETFDFISILSNIQTNSNDRISEMSSGKYEVILEAKPIGVKGTIKPVRFQITVN